MAKKTKTVSDYSLYLGDCLALVPHRVKRGLPTLLCCDPPYNIGQPYESYADSKTQDDYIEYIGERISMAVSHLHPHASVWIAINNTNVSELDIYCKQKLKLFPRAQVRWHFSFGQNGPGSLTPSHITWLYYSRHRNKYTFNQDQVRVPSARQLIYKDKRANPQGRLPDDVWVLRPREEPAAFKPLDDTWLYSRVCGTFKDRVATVPNQMPVPMLDRIIRLSSNPGDQVVDIFNGSGTTGEAALQAGRTYIGFDSSQLAINASTERLYRVSQELS